MLCFAASLEVLVRQRQCAQLACEAVHKALDEELRLAWIHGQLHHVLARVLITRHLRILERRDLAVLAECAHYVDLEGAAVVVEGPRLVPLVDDAVEQPGLLEAVRYLTRHVGLAVHELHLRCSSTTGSWGGVRARVHGLLGGADFKLILRVVLRHRQVHWDPLLGRLRGRLAWFHEGVRGRWRWRRRPGRLFLRVP
ncbi:small myristoylated protein 1 [Leishmania tarentolae]|uniref:Small myristoylated protein 1 n=1 Tax=Leishmania tarentolae TaxID=5689 RepID=A0A640K7W4_LEITA|nr:small myristoylated protein 1 [Leishmania tarentolae]